MLRLPIRVRLTLAYLVVLALLLFALGAFLVLKLRTDLHASVDGELRADAATLVDSYADEGVAGFQEVSPSALARRVTDAQVLDMSGRVIVSYPGDAAEDPILPPGARAAALGGRARFFDVPLGDSSEPFRVFATPVIRNGRRELLIVAESLRGIDDAVHHDMLLLLIAGPIALAAAALVVWWLLRRALLPVERMATKADRIGIDQLHERLAPPAASDELRRLALTLNAMLDRLETGVAAKRQLIADASHELRTPLAAIRAELDVTLRDDGDPDAERATLQSVRDDVGRLSRTLDSLLTLARADEGRLQLLRRPVDLAGTLASAARQLGPLADSQGVSLLVSADPCETEADPDRIHQAITNLIENAIKFTPPGGEVRARTWCADHEAGVTVSDTGVGISEADREHVFDRFFRSDRARARTTGGSGLGLAICQEIAVAHEGRIWVESVEGKGSSFTLALPRREPVEGAGAPERGGSPAPV